MNKMPEFYMIFAPKYFFPEFLGTIPDCKADIEQTNYLIMVDIVLRAQSC